MLVETYKPDNLIADNNQPLHTGTVTVKSGEGELERGSVLSREQNNKFVITASTLRVGGYLPEVILAEDVDATSADAVAEVYTSGDFKEEALKVAAHHTLDEADKADLKKNGIYVKAGL